MSKWVIAALVGTLLVGIALGVTLALHGRAVRTEDIEPRHLWLSALRADAGDAVAACEACEASFARVLAQDVPRALSAAGCPEDLSLVNEYYTHQFRWIREQLARMLKLASDGRAANARDLTEELQQARDGLQERATDLVYDGETGNVSPLVPIHGPDWDRYSETEARLRSSLDRVLHRLRREP